MITKKEIKESHLNPDYIKELGEAIAKEGLKDAMDLTYIREKANKIEHFIIRLKRIQERGEEMTVIGEIRAFDFENKNVQDYLSLCLKCKTEEEATLFLKRYREVEPEYADKNLGYIFGYCSNEDRKKLYKLFPVVLGGRNDRGEGKMLTVTDKTIAFTSDGTLLIFDSRAEFAEWAEGRDNYEAWAETKWLFYTLREQEKTIAELERDNENMTRESIMRVDEIRIIKHR